MSHLEEKQSMDAAASAQTQYSISVGQSFNGVFSDNFDRDWVRVELVAGTTYRISLSGSGDNSGADTILRVFNAAGEQVAVNDDADFGAGQLNSTLDFTPESSGVYYLSAGVYTGNPGQDHSGPYTLTVVDPEADGAAEPSPDHVELEGGGGNDVLRGGGDADVIHGGDGNDMLYGLGGEDFLTGGRGDDLLEGGDDDDLLLGDSASGFFFGPLPADDDPGSGSSSGSSSDDPAAGDDPGNGTAPDNPSAMAGADAVSSSSSSSDDGPGAGHDLHTGGGDDPLRDDPLPLFPRLTRDDVLAFLNDQLHAGNDVLRGGTGDDWMEGGAGDDKLFGGDDDDLLIGDTSLAMFFGGLPVAVVNGASGASAGPDSAAHARGEGANADTILPPGEEDEDPGSFDNLLLMLLIDQLTAGDDLLDGGPGDDILEGGFGNDTLDAGSGDDYLRGAAGDDLLEGGSGHDWLEGGAGADELEGGPGDDILTGDDFSFFLFFEPVPEGPAVDGPSSGYEPSLISVLVPWGDDTLSGDPGDDTLSGDPGDDTLSGGPGDDTLSSGPGDDLLDGGPGNDTLTGGPGADTFSFMHAGGYDVVTDFHAGEDKVDLSIFADIDSVDDLAQQQVGDDLVIDLSAHGGGEITLQHIDQANLTDAHFVFFDGEDPMPIA